jgi:hypothetical protein
VANQAASGDARRGFELLATARSLAGQPVDLPHGAENNRGELVRIAEELAVSSSLGESGPLFARRRLARPRNDRRPHDGMVSRLSEGKQADGTRTEVIQCEANARILDSLDATLRRGRRSLKGTKDHVLDVGQKVISTDPDVENVSPGPDSQIDMRLCAAGNSIRRRGTKSFDEDPVIIGKVRISTGKRRTDMSVVRIVD